ncbi:hypothetical protein KI387_030950 [Taxus chinensis]|uniref:Carboxypeptidase n=1 Tax=Taxus chinensis TaxID=29808 RepID=A0AA38CMA4_TAXCH|nr:hypothetical protein KI387_030950 [Taxus chinensis]
MWRSIVIAVLLVECCYGVGGDQAADKITKLPGQPDVNFDQYGGYVTVSQKDGRALFYWLTEASREVSSKLPLVLWLNGGPGCSSVAYGASEEIGPFRIDKNASGLYVNEFSWNKVANLLFLESPAGVGFSYTNTTSNLFSTGDKRTAQDALIFLLNWFERFPQYRHREFYICGESYAGHYVPQLAKKIYEYNKSHKSKPFINLKGFMVGNAVTDDLYDGIGTTQYWWNNALISDATYQSIMKNCNFSAESYSDACNEIQDYAENHDMGIIDPYSIYSPVCTEAIGNKTKTFKRFKKSMLRRKAGYDPCTENYSEIYYNRKDVQEALHANTTGIPYRWTSCSDVLFESWLDSDFSMLPVYKELIQGGLRIWVFSGDTDSVVPVTATRLSLAHLNLTVKTPWYPWYTNNQTVGGRTEVYEGLTFTTVRGAGHEVPLHQPRRALILFKSFLAGRSLPSSRLPRH